MVDHHKNDKKQDGDNGTEEVHPSTRLSLAPFTLRFLLHEIGIDLFPEPFSEAQVLVEQDVI